MQGEPEYSGGCQCGAVRFEVRGELTDSSICHCRMCQKAFGAYYAPLVSVRGAQFAWTRGEPTYYSSSNLVRRGFCNQCGTPLTYEAPDGMALAAGAFDQPERVPPVLQHGVERKVGFVDALAALPAQRTEEDTAAGDFLAAIVSRQHPDHDTPHWPPQSR